MHKHGHNPAKGGPSPTYKSWHMMNQRCKGSGTDSYHKRGIKVCDRWRDFANFLEDMGERPEGTTLDRIDNTGNYEPGNCRWASKKVQQQNREKIDGTSSMYIGVSFHKKLGKWRAYIHENDESYHLGVFQSEVEAAKRYDKEAIYRFGLDAKVNFPFVRVRDDDVLLTSSDWDDPIKRFKQVHRWIQESDRFIHVPAILVTEIQDFPECIEFIKSETTRRRMFPQIHYIEHIDPGKQTKQEVVDNLNRCLEWFEKQDLPRPSRFYTPWGSSQPHVHEAAKECGLMLIDCSNINKLDGRYGIVRRLLDGENVSFLEGQEVFYHWWVRGLRLQRIIKAYSAGSWAEAAKAEPELYG